MTTVLELVQSVLNDMESEGVNSISDSEEAQLVASVIKQTFNDLVTTRDLPEHQQLLKLTASSDTSYPTEFSYGTNVTNIEQVWYDHQINSPATDADRQYQTIRWVDPIDFIRRVDSVGSDYDTVLERSSGTTLRILNNKHPEYYTSFDNERIVMDSYNSTYDTTLQASKVRAYGTVLPTLDATSDSATVDLDPAHTQYLLREATSRCFDLYKGGTTNKVEQSARRVKVHLQNDRHRTELANDRPHYGR